MVGWVFMFHVHDIWMWNLHEKCKHWREITGRVWATISGRRVLDGDSSVNGTHWLWILTWRVVAQTGSMLPTPLTHPLAQFAFSQVTNPVLGTGACSTCIRLIYSYNKWRIESVWFGRIRQRTDFRGLLGILNKKGWTHRKEIRQHVWKIGNKFLNPSW